MTHTVSEFLYNQDQCHYKQLLMTSETNIKAAQENQGLLSESARNLESRLFFYKPLPHFIAR